MTKNYHMQLYMRQISETPLLTQAEELDQKYLKIEAGAPALVTPLGSCN